MKFLLVAILFFVTHRINKIRLRQECLTEFNFNCVGVPSPVFVWWPYFITTPKVKHPLQRLAHALIDQAVYITQYATHYTKTEQPVNL